MNRPPLPVRALIPALLLTVVALPCYAAPANDNFDSAIALTAGVTTTGTNVAATVQAGEPPSHLQLTAVPATGVATGLSVWYSYTSPVNGLATFSVVGSGTGTAAGALQAGAYTGTSVTALTRVAAASATAGAAGPPATVGTAYPSNVFEVRAGVPVYFQVTGNSATGTSSFDITVSPYSRPGSVVLPRFSTWEWLHPISGTDPTAVANWGTTWKVPGDTTAYNGTAFAPGAANLGFNTFDGAPGIVKDIVTVATGTNNNAAYFRRSFTLPADTSNLWAEVVADDGAYIYIDDLPGFPVNIAARLSNTSFTTSTGFADFRPQADAFLTGAIPAVNANAPVPGCRAYVPTGFNAERHTAMVFLGGLVGKLSAGSHRIAVSLHQTVNTSSDLAFDLQLIDMGAWPLSNKGAGIAFTDTPFVNTSATAAVVPAAEHTHAPGAGQTDLAWHCTSPATRGTTALYQGCVVLDTAGGSQKTFRLNGAEAGNFVTEPINVTGLSQFTASLRVMARETSTGFEAGDGFRVYLETSQDGVNFSEPATPLDIQPRVDGAAGLAPFKDAWVTKFLQVTPVPYNYVRLIISGGVDSASEHIYFDDIRFEQAQLFPVVSNITYDNKGNNDRSDDTVSFDLAVTGSGNTAATWTTSGFGAGNEATGTFGGAAVRITRPAADAGGVRQNVVFNVVDDGNPSALSPVTVTTPAAAIGTITVGVPVRSPGTDLSTTADDTFTYVINAAGTATGSTYEVRSSETGNVTLYGSGAYGTDVTVTVPASVTSVTLKDGSVATLLKAAAVPPAGTDIAMGRTLLNGANVVLYNNPAAVAGFIPLWKQTSATAPVPLTPIPADLELTVTETTATLNAGAAMVAAERGVLESTPVHLTGITGARVTATLRAWEHSTGSGFEAADTFKLEVIETRAGGETTVNLITGNAADGFPKDNVLNGYAGAVATYDANATQDEFNLAAAGIAANSRGTFNFNYPIPDDVTSIKVRATAANDSGNEFFFLKDVVVTNSISLDTDSDGLMDEWELTYFGDLSQNGSGDPDGDGQSNAAEYAAGTSPVDGKSALAVTSATRAGTTVSLTFTSVAGKTYVAQSSTDLVTWTNVGASTPSQGATTVINNLPAGTGVRNYFRVKLVP